MQRQGDILYIYICIYIRIVKYWFKISTASEHRYIYIIYNKCPSSWSLFVRKILYEYGFGYVWEANAVGISHPYFIKQYEEEEMTSVKETPPHLNCQD